MLVKSRYFNGMNVTAVDGMAGKISGMLIDCANWKVRYLVIQNRSLVDRKKFLLSTYNVTNIDFDNFEIKLDVTLESLEAEPFLEKSSAIGVQVQKHFFDLSGWPYYDKMYQVGWLTGPFGILWQTKGVEHSKRKTALHLATSGLMDGFKLMGMSISCRDRDFGVVKNLMIDPKSWECRFLEIRKVKWLPADSTAIPVGIIGEINWKQHLLQVNTHEAKILEAPYYNPRIFSVLNEKLFLQYYEKELIAKSDKEQVTEPKTGNSENKKSIA